MVGMDLQCGRELGLDRSLCLFIHDEPHHPWWQPKNHLGGARRFHREGKRGCRPAGTARAVSGWSPTFG